jgi:xylulose-5-phosphate/fructose-6-phosphate phosphoketolase
MRREKTAPSSTCREELTDLIRGYGYEPHFVEGDVPALVHQSLAGTLDTILAKICEIQKAARSSPDTVERPLWPMIVFRTPRGWSGPKFVDGEPVEGTWRASSPPRRSQESRAFAPTGSVDEKLPPG